MTDQIRTGHAESWDHRLRAAGLRATRPRVLLLEQLDSTDGHHSADTLKMKLAHAGTPLARGTVYKILDDLVEAGLVMQADTGPGTALYEIAGQWHHHFVCRSCQAVIDIPCAVGKKPCIHAELHGAVIDEAQIIFRGTCPDCAATGS